MRTPTSYPSDAQLLPNGNILVAGFDTPGRVDEITPRGRVVWTYGPASGPGSLDRPSLAVRWPNGMIAVTDDWHHRIVVIDPKTKRIVWQYGHFGIASAAPGYLSKPDGLDLLPAAAAPPARALRVRRIGSLPAAASRLAAAPLSGRKDPRRRWTRRRGFLEGDPGRTARAASDVGTLPLPTHDAGLAVSGGTGLLFGGGETVSTDAVVRIDARTGRARRAGSLGEPLSDLGAVSVARGSTWSGGTPAHACNRGAPLPAGSRRRARHASACRPPLRRCGRAGGKIYVAGGVTPAGESDSVFVVDPARGTVRRLGTLPAPVAHAPLVALGGKLYLVGGATPGGAPVARIVRIDPWSGSTTVAGRLPHPLADSAAVRVGSRAIVLGGTSPTPSSAVLALS